MNLKKRLKLILIILLLLAVLAIAYVTTSFSSENGTINFNEENSNVYELSSQNNRSKKISLKLDVVGEDSGFVLVEFVGNDNNIKLEKKLLPGETMDESISFNKGENERIIITSKGFKGKVSYSKKTISM